MIRRTLGTSAALVALYLAVAGALTVDWGVMISGDSERIEREVSEGSGLWGLLSFAFLYASYWLVCWTWADDD